MKAVLTFVIGVFYRFFHGADLALYRELEYTTMKGDVLPYRLLYPENYDPGRKYPIVLFLHGAGERGADNRCQLIHGGDLFLREEFRKIYPCFVLFPQCPAAGYWSSVRADRTKSPMDLVFDYCSPPTPSFAFALELLQKVLAEESIDTTRIYGVGLSMGGMGILEAAYRNVDLFAAVVSICGGGDVRAYDQHTDATAHWLFHGEKDKTVNVGYSRAMAGQLRVSGYEVRYTEYPGVGHASWNRAFKEPELMPWLFAHSNCRQVVHPSI